MLWDIVVTDQFEGWLDAPIVFDQSSASDRNSAEQVVAAVEVLKEEGPLLSRPLVGKITGSRFKNMKELRPGSAGRSEVRVLFCFDPMRQAVLLLGGDKSGNWNRWYDRAIPEAERLYEEHLAAL